MSRCSYSCFQKLSWSDWIVSELRKGRPLDPRAWGLCSLEFSAHTLRTLWGFTDFCKLPSQDPNSVHAVYRDSCNLSEGCTILKLASSLSTQHCSEHHGIYFSHCKCNLSGFYWILFCLKLFEKYEAWLRPPIFHPVKNLAADNIWMNALHQRVKR